LFNLVKVCASTPEVPHRKSFQAEPRHVGAGKDVRVGIGK